MSASVLSRTSCFLGGHLFLSEDSLNSCGLFGPKRRAQCKQSKMTAQTTGDCEYMQGTTMCAAHKMRNYFYILYVNSHCYIHHMYISEYFRGTWENHWKARLVDVATEEDEGRGGRGSYWSICAIARRFLILPSQIYSKSTNLAVCFVNTRTYKI